MATGENFRAGDWRPGRIAIVGSGAVGLYYGCCLARAGADVHFLMRTDYGHAREHGISIESVRGDFGIKPANCYRETTAIGHCDLVIVATKATSNPAVPALLGPLIGPGTVILTLQNGLGNEEWLAAHFGASDIMGGTCFVCLNRIGPARVAHYDHGAVELGEFGRTVGHRAKKIAGVFEDAGVPCRLTDDLAMTRWRKLVWNVPFNGLAVAEAGATVADVLSNSALLSRARRLMSEIIVVANRLGHRIGEDFAEEMVVRSRTMGAYRPSSLLDFEAGRDVEVEAIWGEPLRRGEAEGIPMPELGALYSRLKSMCAGPKVP